MKLSIPPVQAIYYTLVMRVWKALRQSSLQRQIKNKCYQSKHQQLVSRF